jgi:hypothetical protein
VKDDRDKKQRREVGGTLYANQNRSRGLARAVRIKGSADTNQHATDSGQRTANTRQRVSYCK